MSSRKERRIEENNKKRSNKKAKRKLIVMLISVTLMIFSLLQVFFLLKYTLGYNVSSRHLKVYKWVTLLVNGDTEVEASQELENK